jgi:hypothetical protein
MLEWSCEARDDCRPVEVRRAGPALRPEVYERGARDVSGRGRGLWLVSKLARCCGVAGLGGLERPGAPDGRIA